MEVMLNLNDNLQKSEDNNELLDRLEVAYINILKFSSKHQQIIDEFFLSRMKIFISVIVMLIILVLYFLNNKIREIIRPLREITKLSEKLSISNEEKGIDDVSFSNQYEFKEYQVLATSLQEMHQRIHFENRMNSHESASSSISSFAENLAHSINNPLAIIATSVKIINKKAKKDKQEYIESESHEILNEITRITDITHQMKSLIHTKTKMEAENFKAYNIITSINLLFLNKLFEKQIKFIYDRKIELMIFGICDCSNNCYLF